jgi:hypothetical protein
MMESSRRSWVAAHAAQQPQQQQFTPTMPPAGLLISGPSSSSRSSLQQTFQISKRASVGQMPIVSAGGGFHRQYTSAALQQVRVQPQAGFASSNITGNNLNGYDLVPLLDLAQDRSLLYPLPHRSPWKWLAASGVVFGLFTAAIVLSVIALPLPKFSGPQADWFVSIGWILYVIGLLLFLAAAVVLLIRRHPFYRFFLWTYFLALLLMISATVLHTARLPSSALTLPTSSDTLSVQLMWLGCIGLYGFVGWLVKRAAKVTLKMPKAGESDEMEKFRMLLEIRSMQSKKSALLEELRREEWLLDQQRAGMEEQARKDETARQLWIATKAKEEASTTGGQAAGGFFTPSMAAPPTYVLANASFSVAGGGSSVFSPSNPPPRTLFAASPASIALESRASLPPGSVTPVFLALQPNTPQTPTPIHQGNGVIQPAIRQSLTTPLSAGASLHTPRMLHPSGDFSDGRPSSSFAGSPASSAAAERSPSGTRMVHAAPVKAMEVETPRSVSGVASASPMSPFSPSASPRSVQPMSQVNHQQSALASPSTSDIILQRPPHEFQVVRENLRHSSVGPPLLGLSPHLSSQASPPVYHPVPPPQAAAHRHEGEENLGVDVYALKATVSRDEDDD